MRDASVPPGDAELMVAAAEGSQAAFATLVERHQRRVAGHVRRLVGPRDCEDLTQNTFLRAWRYRRHYDSRHSLIGWLLVIASRLCWNHLRQRNTTRFVRLQDCSELPRPERSPAVQVAEEDREAYIRRELEVVLDALQPQVRSLYELRFRQDLAVAEIADHFGVNENTVKQRLHRLRKTLRQALEERLDGC